MSESGTDPAPGVPERFLEAVVSVGSELELAEVLRRVVTAAADLVDAQYGALGVIGEDQTLSEFITVGVTDAQRRHIGEPPKGLGILGLIIEEPVPLRLTDLRKHERASGLPPGHPPMKTFLGVPITAGGAVFGNLYLTDKRGRKPFTASDEQLVIGLAAAAGVAIQNAQMFEERSQHEVVVERDSIARDLHDTVIQRLFAVGMSLQAIQPHSTGVVAERIARAVDELDATIAEIRTSIFALTSPGLPGLRATLLQIANTTSRHGGPHARVRFDGPVDQLISQRQADDVVAVVREAVSNAIRHANATNVTISVGVGDDILVSITDDGSGLPESTTRRSGLANMEQRAKHWRGSMSVHSEQGLGTTLEWRVPRT
jgi:signal transduction histidine kinase